MYTVKFKDVYSQKVRKIKQDSPEILFMKSICEGKNNAEDFFNEWTIYRKRVFLDSPNGRFEGIDEIKTFAEKWLEDFKATRATVYPVIQTLANGRAVTEMEVWFSLKNGETKKVPMVVFADLIGPDRIEGMRIYYFFKFLDNAVAYRKPIFPPKYNTWFEPHLLTGVMRYYYEQLHNFRYEEALENIVEMTSDDVLYGGYRPEEEEPLYQGKDAIRQIYTETCKNCPRANYVRFETITDDSVNCATEWTIVVRQSALAEGFVSFGGCAVYERNEEGKLSSIRICDNAGYDMGIDLNSISETDLFID